MNIRILETKITRVFPDGSRESADAALDRVASAVAEVERVYGGSSSTVEFWRHRFRDLMEGNVFWPAGRILNNAGTRQGQLASCFVLPMPDDFEGIFETVRLAARCHRTGGGTGFDLSRVRERGAGINGSDAAGASGPVSWIELVNAETAVVMSGGKMRGANLAALSVYHPDIFEFIQAKSLVGKLSNFNLSVAVDEPFLHAVEADRCVDLVSPATGRTVATRAAREIWSEIVRHAWRTGDPGLLFIDALNRNNRLLQTLGRITATNPCGEQTLYPYEASNLGSINLAALCRSSESGLDWDGLADAVRVAVRFLDNAIDASRYPDRLITDMAQTNRRIGLGVMGFADLLIRLGLVYDAAETLAFTERLASFFAHVAWDTSEQLAVQRGAFPNWRLSTFAQRVRNCAVTSIAPTGTISMIADCSSGIEPRFAHAYRKSVIEDDGLLYLDDDAVRRARIVLGLSEEDARNRLSEAMPSEIGLRSTDMGPLRYAHDISPEAHVAMVGAWQRHIDNGVSKTVNLPTTATEDDVDRAFRAAWEAGCKGISVYRAGSRSQDLLETVGARSDAVQSKLLTRALAESRVRP